MAKRKRSQRRRKKSTKTRGALASLGKSGGVIVLICTVITAGPGYLSNLRQPLPTPVSRDRPPLILAEVDRVAPAAPTNLRVVR